jgi:hypothetical protein
MGVRLVRQCRPTYISCHRKRPEYAGLDSCPRSRLAELPMKTIQLFSWILAVGGALAAGGCGLQKNAGATVLRTEDFIADPTTTPTERSGRQAASVERQRPDPPLADWEDFGENRPGESAAEYPLAEAPVTSLSPPTTSPEQKPAGLSLGASDGSYDISAHAGEPQLAAAAGPAAGAPVLVDAKVGEINGRPVRVQEMFDELGDRLRAAAATRRFTEDDLKVIGRQGASTPITRAEWIQFTRQLFFNRLDELLQDELLAAEARARLRPEQQAGLRYLVQEMAQQERRRAGGSQAEMTRRLQERGMTEQQFRRRREELLLVSFQLEEQIRRRVRVSWKDVRLSYERNFDFFNPPPKASFRWIQVPADNAAEATAIQQALEAGTPFEQVARRAENRFSPETGGYWGEQPFNGPYQDASFFAEPLDTLARGLKLPADSDSPGGWAGPVDFGAPPMKTWISLDRLEQINRPLSDRDVQLTIARVLFDSGEDVERKRYIDRLKTRAKFDDLETMADLLTQLAVERYWPAALQRPSRD